jgi:hypothetical protein
MLKLYCGVLGDLAHLASIGPLGLRVDVARERLRAGGPGVPAALEALLADARLGAPRARQASVACCIALARDDCAEGSRPRWIDALAREAQAAELPILGALLRDAEPHCAVKLPGRLPDPCVFATTAALFAALPLRLRLRSRWLPADRILMHPDPEVVRRVLSAPALRLEEALVIASRRPTSDAIVREVVLSLRWIGRAEVREALVANPFVHPRLALMLLPTLLGPARRALGRGAIHPLLRGALAELR